METDRVGERRFWHRRRCGAASDMQRRSRHAPAARPVHAAARSGRGFLLSDQVGDLADRVEMLDAGLVGLDGDAEVFLEEDDELERADGIEDSAGDERRACGELGGILAGEELSQDEVMDDLC